MPVPLKTSILVADDHPIVLDGLRRVLDSQADFEVVAEAHDGAEAVERVRQGGVHLAILDVSMPRMTGLQAAREITRHHPDTRVLMLSMHDNEEYLFEALAAGAAGYVLKTSVDRDLVDAYRAAMRGEPFLYPRAVRALVREHLEQARRGTRSGEVSSSRRARLEMGPGVHGANPSAHRCCLHATPRQARRRAFTVSCKEDHVDRRPSVRARHPRGVRAAPR